MITNAPHLIRGACSFSDKRRIQLRMIQFSIMNTRVRFDFTFFAVMAFFLMTDGGVFGFSAILACALHEISHLIMMIIFSVPTETITFYGAGIRISSEKIERAPRRKRNIILLAGSAGNLLFAVILWIAGERISAVINLFTGLFNLLPIGEYDGAVLLRIFAIRRFKAENVDFVMNVAGIFSGIFAVLFMLIFAEKPSVTLLTTLVYLFSSFGLKNR